MLVNVQLYFILRICDFVKPGNPGNWQSSGVPGLWRETTAPQQLQIQNAEKTTNERHRHHLDGALVPPAAAVLQRHRRRKQTVTRYTRGPVLTRAAWYVDYRGITQDYQQAASPRETRLPPAIIYTI